MTLNVNRMYEAAGEGFSTATDVADYLARKGIPFRDAHAITGKIVRYCIEKNKTLTTLSYEEFLAVSDCFDRDILTFVTTRSSVEGRNSIGGSSQQAARAGLLQIKRRLKKY
jgi:argininosuccinate lyase